MSILILQIRTPRHRAVKYRGHDLKVCLGKGPGILPKAVCSRLRDCKSNALLKNRKQSDITQRKLLYMGRSGKPSLE